MKKIFAEKMTRIFAENSRRPSTPSICMENLDIRRLSSIGSIGSADNLMGPVYRPQTRSLRISKFKLIREKRISVFLFISILIAVGSLIACVFTLLNSQSRAIKHGFESGYCINRQMGKYTGTHKRFLPFYRLAILKTKIKTLLLC